jgi:uncharacterized protein DUF3667
MQEPTRCPNCDAPITGKYCAQCGQPLEAAVLSLPRILRDVLEDQFSLNSTLLRTLRGLLFKPGFLTVEYFKRHIARYVPPFRLYLVCSVLFFLLVALVTRGDREQLGDRWKASLDSVATRANTAAGAGELRREILALRLGWVYIGADPRDPDWARYAQVNTGSKLLDRAIRQRFVELGRRASPEEAFLQLMSGFIENTPKAMFVLLPVFAVLLKLLYIRRQRLYVEHFIFALHIHAFFFLTFVLMLLLRNLSVAPPLLYLSLAAYLLLALKRVYGQGWLPTSVKWVALATTYHVILAIGVLAAFVTAIFMT